MYFNKAVGPISLLGEIKLRFTYCAWYMLVNEYSYQRKIEVETIYKQQENFH